MNKFFCFILFTCFSIPIFAQDQLAVFEKKYPGAISVILKKQEEVSIDLVKDSVKVRQAVYAETLHLSDRSNIYTEGSIAYSSFSRLLDLDAWSMVPKGSGFKKVNVTEFKDTNLEDASIFYDDSKIRKFTYPGLGKGTITGLKYTKSIPEIRLLPTFYFQTGLPAEEISFTLKVHKNISIAYKLFNCDASLGYSSYTKGDFIYHIWKISGQKGFKGEDNAPEANYYLPHILYKITSIKSNGKETPVLASVNDLYKWQFGFVNKVLNAPVTELKDVVNSIVKPSDTETEKAEKIYSWVKENIKYVAFENGFRGFIPHDPALTLNHRYGDCKDMAALLYAMLKAAGVNSHLTWIGTRDISYNIADFSSQHDFNHMIVTYLGPDRPYFLDATDRHGIFGHPASHIQGKDALLAVSEKEYLIKKVEVPVSQKNLYTDTVYFTINDKKLEGKGKSRLSGYRKITASYYLTDKTEEAKDAYLKSLLNIGGNKFLLNDFKIDNLNNQKNNTVINYSCTIDDLVKTSGNELYVNMNLNRAMDNATIELEDRQLPIDYAYQSVSKYVFKIKIPAGYKIDFLPKEKEFKEQKFGFKIKHSSDGQYLIYEKQLYMDMLMLEKPDFTSWNNFIRELSKTYRESVILKKS